MSEKDKKSSEALQAQIDTNPLMKNAENADANSKDNNNNASDISPAKENTKDPVILKSSENGSENVLQEAAESEYISPEFIKAEEQNPIKLKLARHIAAGAMLIISLLVLIISRESRAFADWLCFNVYPVFSGIGSRIWGVFPFSCAEILVALVILGALTGLVFLVRHTIKHKGQRIKAFLNGFSWAELTVSILFLTVTFNCLVGYNRTPFSQYSGLTLKEYTAEELKELTLSLIDQANEIAEKVDLDGEGRPDKPRDFNKYAVKAMEALGEKYEVLKTYYPQPKGVLCSDLMSSFNLAGIYFPVTVEANFNQAMPVSSQAFTACHELSHLSGFIREDEANFIAFMACRESESTYFRYSGYLGALTYALNALHGAVSSEEYNEVCGKLSSVILKEYAYRNEYWSPYQKKVTYKVSSVVNDTYLKANNQTDGTKSYGRIVDLMLAEYFGEK
ncbi:MAG: DUF3810 domain-containing protein [Ruminiclostridium sp.]|nr:DUF3810 domain-containing protein [Ruminiclostridium sp.]